MKIYDSWKSWEQARAQVAFRMLPATLTGLDRAFCFATFWHGDQLRPSGEPYVHHLLEVIEILFEGAGISTKEVLIAGVLHDVLEDTACRPEEIRDRFGPTVHDLVVWLTKPQDAEGDPPDAAKKGYLDALRHGPAGARLVKLADRLSNVQRLDRHPSASFQRSYYRETVESVLPLAEEGDWFARQYAQWREEFAYLEAAPGAS